MGARGPRTLDPLSLGSQPSGVTRVTRLVTRCVAPAWDVARCFWHASQIFRGPFGFSSFPRVLFLLPRFFIERLSRRGAKAAQERRPLETPGRGDPDGDQVSTNLTRAKPRGRVSDGTVPARAVLSSARGEH